MSERNGSTLNTEIAGWLRKGRWHRSDGKRKWEKKSHSLKTNEEWALESLKPAKWVTHSSPSLSQRSRAAFVGGCERVCAWDVALCSISRLKCDEWEAFRIHCGYPCCCSIHRFETSDFLCEEIWSGRPKGWDRGGGGGGEPYRQEGAEIERAWFNGSFSAAYQLTWVWVWLMRRHICKWLLLKWISK